MKQTKGFFSSVTNWSAIVGSVFVVLDTFGVNPGVTSEQVMDFGYKLGELAAFGTAIVGRVRATRQIRIGG